MRRTLSWIVGLVCVAVYSAELVAKDYPRWAGGNLQIQGYDTTAYFSAGHPTMGKSKHLERWQQGTWRFTSAKQAAQFRTNPSSYIPQFGAYCTGGLSQRHVVNGDPHNWRIHKGRLYLFYSANGARRFDTDPEGTIKRARNYAKKVGIREN